MEPVLIMSENGYNRSVVAVTAHLICNFGWTLKQALEMASNFGIADNPANSVIKLPASEN